MKVIKHNQSFFDACFEATGSITAIFEDAIQNDVSITDHLQAGKELIFSKVVDEQIYNYLNNNNHIPATALKTENLDLIQNKGIGYMGVGLNFIIG